MDARVNTDADPDGRAAPQRVAHRLEGFLGVVLGQRRCHQVGARHVEPEEEVGRRVGQHDRGTERRELHACVGKHNNDEQ